MRFFERFPVYGLAALAAAALPPAAFAAHPEVLLVYNTNVADSLNVANHYMAQRGVPQQNLCAITPPSTDTLSLDDYTTYVKTPVQACLNTVGSKSILYIVMSYMTPYRVGAGPMGVAAVDSYLADIWDKYVSQPFLILPNTTQPYYADSQSQGNVYTPFQSFAAYRANARNPLIYSVWRLDAPTAALASALVDQAIAAETAGGPAGQACIDETYDPSANPVAYDAGTPSGNWDLFRASQFLTAAGLTVLTDVLSTEFGTPPSPNCPDTAFYSGWYSLENYNNAFTWQTGSVGWHLDSASALSPRSGDSWAPNALLNGIAVTSGSVTEPYLQGLVRPGGTFRNLLEGASVGDAMLRNTRWLKWEIMNMGDPLYKPFGSGLTPFSPLQPVNSFLISPQEIVGGNNTTGTITLSAPAPQGGTTFNLSAGPGASVPPTVMVAAGTTKTSFPITTTVVTSPPGTQVCPGTGSSCAIITATGGSLTLQNTVITDTLLGGLVPAFNPTMAGYPVGVTVILNGRAPAGGAAINLSSDNAAVTVPATVTVPAGTMVTTFNAGSTPVSTSTMAHITGTYAGATAGFSLTVVPAIQSFGASPSTINAGDSTQVAIYLGTQVPPGNTATVQLMSSNPAALPVPASITIAAGSNYGNLLASSSAGSSGNTVTITATYGGATAMATVTIN